MPPAPAPWHQPATPASCPTAPPWCLSPTESSCFLQHACLPPATRAKAPRHPHPLRHMGLTHLFMRGSGWTHESRMDFLFIPAPAGPSTVPKTRLAACHPRFSTRTGRSQQRNKEAAASCPAESLPVVGGQLTASDVWHRSDPGQCLYCPSPMERTPPAHPGHAHPCSERRHTHLRPGSQGPDSEPALEEWDR